MTDRGRRGEMAAVLDLHNHVLFGLDDGCRTLDESRELSAKAKAAGHRGFVATPHIRAGMFDNDPDGIRRRRDQTAPTVLAEGLELYLGAEYWFDMALLESARNKTLLTLGETSRFVLTELPQNQLPVRFEDVLYELRLAGYVPVIAHPERCGAIADDLDRAQEMFQRAGALLQLDLGSLVGAYGRSAKKAGTELVKRGAYHVAACDLHRPGDVHNVVAPARKVLASLLAKRKVVNGEATLFEHNPQKIVNDAPIDAIAPV